MDIENAKLFMDKIDEILADTEEFVNATKQLAAVRNSLESYISDTSKLIRSVSKTLDDLSKTVDYAQKFFKGDFTADIEKLMDEVKESVKTCSEQSILFKKQYDRIINSGNFIELQLDHSNIMDAIDELKEKQEESDRKLDRIIEIIESSKSIDNRLIPDEF